MQKVHGDDSQEHREAIADLDALRGPDWPEALDWLYRAFCDIRRGARADMSGAVRITWADIDAWERHSGVSLDPEDVDAIFALDAAWQSPDEKG